MSLYSQYTQERVAIANLAAQLLNASGKLDHDVSPSPSQTNFGTSVYLQFRVNGDFFKVRYSDHHCLRSGEIECYTATDLLNWVDRFLNPSNWEYRHVVVGRKTTEVNEKDMLRFVEEREGVVISSRVTSKGSTHYTVEFNECQLQWVKK